MNQPDVRVVVNLNVAILGGTSHIARAITPYLLDAGTQVTLFARNPEKLAGSPCRVIREITEADSMQNRPNLLGGCSVLP